MPCGRARGATRKQIAGAKTTGPGNPGGLGTFREKTSGGVLHVHRQAPGGHMFLPWVSVRASKVGGRGVFAATTFHKGEPIGMYTGRVMGSLEDKGTEEKGVRSKSTMLLDLNGVLVDGARKPQPEAAQRQAAGTVLFPKGAQWPGAYAHMINSGFDMGRGKMAPGRQNCELSSDGLIRAIKTIRPGEELIQNYGRSYHMQMK